MKRPFAILAVGALGCGQAVPVRVAVELPARNARAAYMAADEINAAGGISGRALVIVRDTVNFPGEAADVEIRRAESVVAMRPVAVIGHGGSRGSLAAAPVYNEAGIVQVVPTGTSRLLAVAGPWTLPLLPNDSIEGVFVASWIRDTLRARSAAVLYVSDEYGVGLRNGVTAALAGGPVRVTRVVPFGAESDLDFAVDALLRGGAPDVVFVAGRLWATVQIVKRLSEVGARSRVVAGDGAMGLPELADSTGPAGQGLLVATFWLPGGPLARDAAFVDAFRARFGEPPIATDALVYDAVRLVSEAARAVGDDPARLRSYLLSLGVSRPRFPGVTGEIGLGAGAGPPRLVMAEIRGREAKRAEAVDEAAP